MLIKMYDGLDKLMYVNMHIYDICQNYIYKQKERKLQYIVGTSFLYTSKDLNL